MAACARFKTFIFLKVKSPCFKPLLEIMLILLLIIIQDLYSDLYTSYAAERASHKKTRKTRRTIKDIIVTYYMCRVNMLTQGADWTSPTAAVLSRKHIILVLSLAGCCKLDSRAFYLE